MTNVDQMHHFGEPGQRVPKFRGCSTKVSTKVGTLVISHSSAEPTISREFSVKAPTSTASWPPVATHAGSKAVTTNLETALNPNDDF